MIATKSVNRGWLLRRAKAGKLWVKCNFHLTDDYAHDAAVKFGKMDDFKQVYVREIFSSPLEQEVNDAYGRGANHQDVEPLMEELRRQREAFSREQEIKANGKVMLWQRDFQTKSGHCSGDQQSGSFSVHSNLSYSYEVRP